VEAEPGTINLATLGGGVMAARFDEELAKVVENILDLNTEATRKREIVLRVSIKPTADRNMGVIGISADSKLAPVTSFATKGFFGRRRTDGKLLALEHDPKQLDIEGMLKTRTEGVTPITTANPAAPERAVQKERAK
jgi:hypothetical protein